MLHEDTVFRRPASRYVGKWLEGTDYFIQSIKENSYQAEFLIWEAGEGYPGGVASRFSEPFLSINQRKWTANYGGDFGPPPKTERFRELIKSLFKKETYRFVILDDRWRER